MIHTKETKHNLSERKMAESTSNASTNSANPRFGSASSAIGNDTQIYPYEIEVRDINYSTGKGKKQKHILTDINATFSRGENVAVIGPRKSGKSTLLNVIAGNMKPCTGEILFNGSPVPKGFHSMYFLLPKEQVLYPGLTPRQTLLYSAQLRLQTLTSANRKVIVNEMLEEMRLLECADTIIGRMNKTGITLGQRKRTCIANELIMNPSVIFLDEPTSGILDVKEAEEVVISLSHLARKFERTIISTVHQPTWQVFQKFDKLLMLNKGKVVYHGDANTNVIEYFSAIGYELPVLENPLTYYVRELEKESEQDFFANAWNVNENKALLSTPSATLELKSTNLRYEQELLLTNPLDKSSNISQYNVLLRRAAHDALKDKKILTGFLQKLGFSVFIGILFLSRARLDSNRSIEGIETAIFATVMFSLLGAAFKNIFEFKAIQSLIVQEYKNRAYNILPYFAAQLTLKFSIECINAHFTLATYLLVGFGTTLGQAYTFVLTMLLLSLVGTALGLVVGSLIRDSSEIRKFLLPIVPPAVLFSGFTIDYQDMSSGFVWLYHMSFVQYAMSSVLANEFTGKVFGDCPAWNSTDTDCLKFKPGCFETGNEYLDIKDIGIDQIPLFLSYISVALGIFVFGGYFVFRHQMMKAAKAI